MMSTATAKLSRTWRPTGFINSSGAVLYRREAAVEKKNFQKFPCALAASFGKCAETAHATAASVLNLLQCPCPQRTCGFVINSRYEARAWFGCRASRYGAAGSRFG